MTWGYDHDVLFGWNTPGKKKSAGEAEAFIVMWSPSRRKEISNTVFYFSKE